MMYWIKRYLFGVYRCCGLEVYNSKLSYVYRNYIFWINIKTTYIQVSKSSLRIIQLDE